SSRRRHTRFKCDWSSDVCSSDLVDDALLRKSVIRVDPMDELGDGDAQGVIYGAIDSRGHDFLIVFKARPAGALPFHQFELEASEIGRASCRESVLVLVVGVRGMK